MTKKKKNNIYTEPSISNAQHLNYDPNGRDIPERQRNYIQYKRKEVPVVKKTKKIKSNKLVD